MTIPVVHWELLPEDPERVSEFCPSVFCWNIRNIPEMNYHLAEAGGESGIGGGIMKPQEGPWPAKLALCIDVEDLAESRKKIVDPGGTIDVEQVDMPGIGSMILFEDPDGRVIGLWKQQGQPTED